MFALRRVPKALPRSLVVGPKFNSTLAEAPPATESSPPPAIPTTSAASEEIATTTAGRRRRKQIPKRPKISLEAPRKWNRALAPGVVPAYDLALEAVRKDSAKLKQEAAELHRVVESKEAAYHALKAKLQLEKGQPAEDAIRLEMQSLSHELEASLKKLNILEVQSDINLPWVRWTVNNAMADMTTASHRYLVEQKWRKDGDLDLLMERLYQMNVVPDVLSEIKPSLDLQVVVRSTSSQFIEDGKRHTHIEPGVFVKSKQTKAPPKLRVNVFHTDTRLYTMLLIDPDVPDPENQTFTTFLHWMKPNIPLSATSTHLTQLDTHTKYIPPHPQQGTPYHRYVVLLLPQAPLGASEYTLAAAARADPKTPTSVSLPIPVVPDEERLGFNVRAFAQKWNLNASNGGGAHMFREVWDKDVSTIYSTILNKPEPRYGRPPSIDMYADLKEKKKYTL